MTNRALQTRRRPYNSRARQAQAEATKSAILKAARSVFAELGYAASTIEAVANAAGVSVPTVYAVFRSKPRLLSAVVADAGADLDIRRLAENAMRETDPTARIAAAAKVIRTIIQRERGLLEVLREAGGGTPELQDARRQVHRQQREALARVLEPLHRSGSLRSGVDFDDALATFSALAAPETYWLLVDEIGWSWVRWERWLAESMIRLFLDSG